MEASKNLLAVIKYFAGNDDLEGLADELCLLFDLDHEDAEGLDDYLNELKATD